MAETSRELFAELEPEVQSSQDLFRALEPEAEQPWWSFAKREWGKEVEALKSTPENLAQSIEWGVRQFDPKNLAAFPSNLGDLWMWVARQMPEQQDFPETWAEASVGQKALAGAQVVSLAGLITILTSQGLSAVNAARTAYRMWRNTKNIAKAEELAKMGKYKAVKTVTGKEPYVKTEAFKGEARVLGKPVERGGVERGRLPLADTKRVVESGWTAPKEPVGGPGIPEAAKSITGVRARAAAEFAKNIPTATKTVGKNWTGDELERIGLSVVERIAPKAQFNEVLTTTHRALTPLIKDLPAKMDVGAAETIAHQFFVNLIPMANQLATGIEPTALKPEKPAITVTEEVTTEEPLVSGFKPMGIEYLEGQTVADVAGNKAIWTDAKEAGYEDIFALKDKAIVDLTEKELETLSTWAESWGLTTGTRSAARKLDVAIVDIKTARGLYEKPDVGVEPVAEAPAKEEVVGEEITPELIQGELNIMRQEVAEGEPGQRIQTEAGEWIAQPSTYPDWMRDNKLNKKEVMAAFEKKSGATFNLMKSVAEERLEMGYESAMYGKVPPAEVPEGLVLAMKDTTTGKITESIEGEFIHTDMMARLGERYGDMEPGWVGSGGKFYNAFEVRRGLAGAEPIKAGVPPEVPPIGFRPPTPPTPPPAEMPQEPEQDPLVKLTALIKGAKRLRPRVEEAYARERGKRFGEVEDFIEEKMDTVGGEEGFRAILGKMKGELVPPEAKAAFEPIKDKMTDEEFKNLLLRSLRHPYLTTGEKLSAADGLSVLLMGQLPQPRQLVLLEEVYGSELVKELLKKRAWGPKAMEAFVEIANIPRVLLATADMSGVLRQNIIPTVAHPIIAAKATGKAFQAAFSPGVAKEYFDDLRKADDFSFIKQMGISITDPTRATLVEREEAFISRFLSKVPGINIPIGFAERGYTLLLTKTRVDLFRMWAKEFRAQGLDIVKDVDVFKAAADVVNTFTGRGSLGKMGNRIAPQLNILMFSPRLVAARFQALNPIWYAKQPKPVRKKAIADFAKFVAAGTTTLAMIKIMAEDDDNITVETDPRSSDFGKIRVGNTRYDIWGGFQQWARVYTQIATGERKTTTTGEIISLNKEEYPFTTRKEVFLRFAEGKLAPTPALVNELMSGAKTFEGEDISLKSVAFEKFIPMYIQDIAEAYEDGGFERAFPAGVAAFMGIGVQTWEPRKKKAAKAYWFED